MPDEVIDTTESTDDDAALAAEVAELTASPSDQQAAKIQAALIAAKKGERAARRRVAELEPVAQRTADVEAQLARVGPIITAVTTNPKLLAEAQRIANGTAPSRETTDQPSDDGDAVAMAEELGFYLGDGVTPDAARGKRVLDRLDVRHGRQTDDRIRPLAGVTLGQKADSNIRAAMAETDDDGVPMATAESIREVAAQLPPQLLADPKVVDVVLNSAIGLDRRKKRTPKAPDEPMYLASAGGGRARPTSIYSPEDKRVLSSLGLTDEDIKRTSSKLEKAGGGTVQLGSS